MLGSEVAQPTMLLIRQARIKVAMEAYIHTEKGNYGTKSAPFWFCDPSPRQGKFFSFLMLPVTAADSLATTALVKLFGIYLLPLASRLAEQRNTSITK